MYSGLVVPAPHQGWWWFLTLCLPESRLDNVGSGLVTREGSSAKSPVIALGHINCYINL